MKFSKPLIIFVQVGGFDQSRLARCLSIKRILHHKTKSFHICGQCTTREKDSYGQNQFSHYHTATGYGQIQITHYTGKTPQL